MTKPIATKDGANRRKPRSRPVMCYVAAFKYLVVSYYGKTMRGANAMTLKEVAALTEYEVSHGADKIEILVNRHAT